jgi:hypothetical protein
MRVVALLSSACDKPNAKTSFSAYANEASLAISSADRAGVASNQCLNGHRCCSIYGESASTNNDTRIAVKTDAPDKDLKRSKSHTR